MKLLIFAHKPPPHHGQSFMVQLLLEVLGRGPAADPGGRRIVCHHVDARFSRDVQDIGRARLGKLPRLLGYAAQAIGCRLRHGVTHFYYIPADTNRSALWRDWLVMLLCRPFFKHLIYHWEAAGLGAWLEEHGRPWQRWLSRRLLMRPRLSVVLSEFGRADAVAFASHQVAVVPNAVPDPCPDFERAVLPRRQARAALRRALLAGQPAAPAALADAGPEPRLFQVLYASLCHREKGIFDAVEAVAQAAPRFRAAGLRLKLVVAGAFYTEADRQAFEERRRRPDLNADGPAVEYRGFISGPEKDKLFLESDCFCFPTCYAAESFGVVLVEAMAWGLPVVATRWRMIPELVPPGYRGLVPPHSPQALAAALFDAAGRDHDPALRARFLQEYTEEVFARRMTAALLSLEADAG